MIRARERMQQLHDIAAEEHIRKKAVVRQQQNCSLSLVFKSVIYELRSDLLLVEFRRTKVTTSMVSSLYKLIFSSG